MRSRCFQEIYVLLGVVLTVDELIDFFLAAKEVSVSLEEALSQIIEDRQTNRFYFQTECVQQYALVL